MPSQATESFSVTPATKYRVRVQVEITAVDGDGAEKDFADINAQYTDVPYAGVVAVQHQITSGLTKLGARLAVAKGAGDQLAVLCPDLTP